MSADTLQRHAGIEWDETLRRLRVYIQRRVGDRQLAEDITQDVIVRSIAAGALDRVDNPIGWLIRSASNAIIDHYRVQRRHEPIGAASDGVWVDAVGDDDDAGRQLAHCVQPLVGRLDPIYREAVTWIDLEGRTQAAAARAAGVSLSGMKSRVQRGRRQLRALMTECCAITVDRRGAPTHVQPHQGSACSCSER